MGISSALGSSALLPAGLGFRNKIINGDFRINQRAFTSTTSSGVYGFDRWFLSTGGGTGTYSAQTFTIGSGVESGYEAQNFARVVTTGQSAPGDFTILCQRIEDVRNCAGATATVSFWARAGSGTPKVAVELAQSFGTGGSPSSQVTAYFGQATLSTSWQRFVFTAAVPSISGKTIGTDVNSSSLRLNLWVSGGSDFNSRLGSLGLQSATFDFWGVQVEQNYQPTPFEQRPIGVELALCQRYYEKSYDMATAPGTITTVGAVSVIYQSTYGAATGFRFQVRKRGTPAVRGYPPASGTNNGVGYWSSASDATNRAVTFGNIGESGVRYITLTSSSANLLYEGHYEADAEL